MSENIEKEILKILDYSKNNKEEIRKLKNQIGRLHDYCIEIHINNYRTYVPDCEDHIIEDLFNKLLAEREKIQQEIDLKLQAIGCLMRG